ncbi:MAG: FecR domain-containing protein, partial [Bauldia sp.]|nr:FecR domain-containing protein [Bauldia sp.]
EDDATEAAAHWLVALEEEPDDAELRARFEAWRAASPANAAAWANTADVYELIGTPPYVAHREQREAAKVVALPRRRRASWVLAGAALAACLAWLFVPGLLLDLRADHITATAELREVTLDDGSIVQLAPGSAIEVRYRRDREVALLKGEALFTVTPDATRPFRVVAGNVETTVLGTVFDVRRFADDVAVSVREGMVRVAMADGVPPVSERLQPGDSMRIAAGGKVVRDTVAPSEVAAWRRGQIVARSLAVADVVDELRRSFAGAIVLVDGALGRQRVTGVYNLDEPEAALRAAVGVHGGTVRRVSPWLLVVSTY